MGPSSNLTSVLARGLTQRKEQVRTEGVGGHLQSDQRDLGRNQPRGHPNLGLPALRTWRNKFPLSTPPSLQYLATTCLAKLGTPDHLLTLGVFRWTELTCVRGWLAAGPRRLWLGRQPCHCAPPHPIRSCREPRLAVVVLSGGGGGLGGAGERQGEMERRNRSLQGQAPYLAPISSAACYWPRKTT